MIETERKWEWFSVHWLNPQITSKAKPEPTGSWDSETSSRYLMRARGPKHLGCPASLPHAVVGSWIRSGIARTHIGAYMGCQHCRELWPCYDPAIPILTQIKRMKILKQDWEWCYSQGIFTTLANVHVLLNTTFISFLIFPEPSYFYLISRIIKLSYETTLGSISSGYCC